MCVSPTKDELKESNKKPRKMVQAGLKPKKTPNSICKNKQAPIEKKDKKSKPTPAKGQNIMSMFGAIPKTKVVMAEPKEEDQPVDAKMAAEVEVAPSEPVTTEVVPSET